MAHLSRMPPRAEGAMLFVVDALNLFHGARNVYGRGARVDFKKLRDHVVGGRNYALVYGIAFVPELADGAGDGLQRAFHRLGYTQQSRVEDFKLQVAQLERLTGYTHLAVASSDTAFLPLCQVYRTTDRHVDIFAFPSGHLPLFTDVAQGIHLLQVDVLMGEFSTIAKLKEAP